MLGASPPSQVVGSLCAGRSSDSRIFDCILVTFDSEYIIKTRNKKIPKMPIWRFRMVKRSYGPKDGAHGKMKLCFSIMYYLKRLDFTSRFIFLGKTAVAFLEPPQNTDSKKWERSR